MRVDKSSCEWKAPHLSFWIEPVDEVKAVHKELQRVCEPEHNGSNLERRDVCLKQL